jgi:glycosyltransferase involved in cell wall biosynthesis
MKLEEDILFSIIIPTFNRANLIEIAINSVIKQSYSNWELIIVDNGSTDNTKEIIAKIEDKRINYIYTSIKGRSKARNLGLNQAKGGYIAFLDDDDYYYEEFLQKFCSEIINRNKALGIYMCNQDEETKSGDIVKGQTIDYANNKTRVLFEYCNNFQPFCTSKEILQKEKFNPKFELGEDFHILFRILLQYPLFYIPKSLCVYKSHDEMTMEHEFKSELFLKLPNNRLDTLEDLFQNHKDLIKSNEIERFLVNRYNKVIYFYSSMGLKLKKYGYSVRNLKKLKIRSSDILRYFYYISSILVRTPYFYIISKLKND